MHNANKKNPDSITQHFPCGWKKTPQKENELTKQKQKVLEKYRGKSTNNTKI